jgi:hypothetical protein
LRDAYCRINAVNKLAGQRFGMTLTGREIVIIMVETGVETRICGRHTGYAVKN